MEFGLPENTCTILRAIFNQYSAVQKAVIYGSRAKGNYKSGSDIDLTLFGDALNDQTLSAIAGALDESLIPYTVDLSLFNTIENSALREHIECVGVTFYARN